MKAFSCSRETFGKLADGSPVELLRLHGGEGFEVRVITYGASVQTLRTPDRDGRLSDVVLGHETLEPYLTRRQFFGATVGRYANRIAGAGFVLNGIAHTLAANDGPNALHGGLDGFDRRVWAVEAMTDAPVPSVTLARVSPDGEEGYPGTLHARVTYAVTGSSELSITFEAVTDSPTIANFTHHGFFNLAGVEKGVDTLDHVLTIHADEYLPIDAGAIPLGSPAPVIGTPFDFRSPKPIGERIRETHEQLERGRGYDHNYCLIGGRSAQPRLAAKVEHPGSGRVMELLTDQPGLQFYSGNFLDGSTTGKFGRLHRQSDAFCLEPQCWPNAPNRPDYPRAVLEPGERYRHVSIYRFSSS